MLTKIPLQPDITAGSAINWYHLSEPTAEEIRDCCQRWKLPADYLTAVLDPHEIAHCENLDRSNNERPALIAVLYPIKERLDEKLSAEPNSVSFKSERSGQFKTRPDKRFFLQESGSYSVRLISIIWGTDFVLTASARPLEWKKLLTARRHPDFYSAETLSELEMAELEPALKLDKTEGIISLIIWEVTRQFIQATRVLMQRRERILTMTAHSAKSELLMAVSQLQESLVRFETAQDENHAVIARLADCSAFLSSRYQEEWLADIQKEVAQAETMVHQEAKMLHQLNQTFSSVISNNLNVTMKILTSLTIILTVPTIISGVWGMNVALPMETWPAAFWILSAVTSLLCLLVAYLLYRRDLL